MKKVFEILLVIVSLVVLIILPAVKSAFALREPLVIFGKDLLVKGSIQHNLDYRTHRDERDVAISSNKTTFRLEGTYDLLKSEGMDICLYSLLTYWHDTGVDTEANLRRAVGFEDSGSHGLKEFRRSNEGEEILKEIYLEFKTSSLQARFGKQIVSWGETAEARVADVINPLDLVNLKVFPDWEDLKVGLWMARLFYTPPNMWQDLSFEFVFIPPDFQYTRMPVAGHGLFFGVPQMGKGVFGKILHKQKHDRPANDWSNAEMGLRIRGYSWDIDWTVSHFYSRLDSPLIDGEKGFNEFMNLMFGLPSGKIYTYPHYQSTAFTFSVDATKIRSTIRGEVVLNNRDYQFGTYKIRSKKLLTTAVTLNRSTFIPWLTPWNRQRFLGVEVTWMHYKLLAHKNDRATGEFITWESGTRDSSWDKISMMLDYSFHYNDFQQFFNIVYDFNGNTTVMGVLRYAPGDHWRFDVTYQQLNEQGRNMHMQDQMMFSVRYEF